MASFVVYILFSQNYDRTYVGQTNDIEKRKRRHDDGMVRSTRAYRPWILVQREVFETRAEAMRREAWYKTGVGREEINRMLATQGLR
jgi:putative endonuclease